MQISQKHKSIKIVGLLIASFLLLFVLLGIFWETAMQRVLLNKMLYSEGYTLNNDATTNKRLDAILPKLIEIHKTAVAESKGNVPTQEHLQDLEAFNTRISAWSAIRIILKVQHNQTGIDYVKSFIRSSQAIPEEIKHGEKLLDEIKKGDKVRPDAPYVTGSTFS